MYAYLAGILDGDGALGASHTTKGPRLNVSVKMRSPEIPTFLHAHLTGSLFACDGGRSLKWDLVRRADVVHVMRNVHGHLRIKRRPARAAMALLEVLAEQPSYDVPAKRVGGGEGLKRLEHRRRWRDAADEAARIAIAERTTATSSGELGVDEFVAGSTRPVDHQLPPHIAAYLAGILDAEGHLRAGGSNGKLAIHVGNRARCLIDWLYWTVGGSARFSHTTTAGNAFWVWSVHRHSDLASLLEQTTPFAVGKHFEMRAMLTALRWESDCRAAGVPRDRRVRRLLRQAIRDARPRVLLVDADRPASAPRAEVAARRSDLTPPPNHATS